MSITVQPATTVGAVQSQGGGVAPNGTFDLWQMLMEIMKYEKTVLDNSAEMQKNWAQSLGGSNGIYAKLYNIGVDVGDQEAKGLQADAISKFVQCGVMGGSLVASGVKYFGSTRPEINSANAGIKDANNFEEAIKNSQAGMIIGERPPIDANVQNHINGWADGSESVENFGALKQDGSIDAEKKALNQAAAENVANDPNKGKILKQISKQKTSMQSRIQNAESSANTFQQINSTATQGLSSAAAAGGSIGQASHAEAKGQASAANTVVSQVQQQVVEEERKAAQNAMDALQQANQWAASFAQAAAAQVHA